jgi:hypothetical protein
LERSVPQLCLFLNRPYEDQKLMISRLQFCGVMIDVTGKTAAGDEVEGKVTVPEVSHEMIDGHSKYEVSPGIGSLTVMKAGRRWLTRC